MRIYLCGTGGIKSVNEFLGFSGCARLFSYFAIVDELSAYGERERFEEVIEYIKRCKV